MMVHEMNKLTLVQRGNPEGWVQSLLCYFLWPIQKRRIIFFKETKKEAHRRQKSQSEAPEEISGRQKLTSY